MMASRSKPAKGEIFQNIVKELRRELTDGRYRPHDQIYSERALSEKFQVNFATGRRAVEELVREGLLYKIPSRGTFVAPQRKNRLILIVTPAADISLIRYCGAGRMLETSYRFREILEEEYLKHVDDLELLYPEICGLIFYRDERRIIHTFPRLAEKSLPFIFYGSSSHEEQLKGISTLLYSEEKVVACALDQAAELGCRKIGILYSSAWSAILERFVQFLKWMKQHNLIPDPDWIVDESQLASSSREKWHKDLCGMLKEGCLKGAEAIFCADDELALQLSQAALDAGIKVPDTLKIVGVNNSAICDLAYPTLSSVEIPVAEDCERLVKALIEQIEGKRTKARLKSRVRLVRRTSL